MRARTLMAFALLGLSALCWPAPGAQAQEINPKAQVEQFIKSTLETPRNYESLDWSKLVKLADGPYSQAIRHSYRLLDSKRGWLKYDNIFYLDSEGRVLGATNTSRWRSGRWGAGKEKW